MVGSAGSTRRQTAAAATRAVLEASPAAFHAACCWWPLTDWVHWLSGLDGPTLNRFGHFTQHAAVVFSPLDEGALGWLLARHLGGRPSFREQFLAVAPSLGLLARYTLPSKKKLAALAASADVVEVARQAVSFGAQRPGHLVALLIDDSPESHDVLLPLLRAADATKRLRLERLAKQYHPTSRLAAQLAATRAATEAPTALSPGLMAEWVGWHAVPPRVHFRWLVDTPTDRLLLWVDLETPTQWSVQYRHERGVVLKWQPGDSAARGGYPALASLRDFPSWYAGVKGPAAWRPVLEWCSLRGRARQQLAGWLESVP